MAEGTKAPDAGRSFVVKFLVFGKAPEPTSVPEGMTVGQLLDQKGYPGWEATIGTKVVGPDHVLKEGEAIILKQRLQAGR